ncbi:MAG: uroporphyrinogen-III synthase [Sphingomonadales bacterium]|nr:uroporphyrinogen-III synthase [Sphingomonadales bacterium]PIX67239.1 MAG: uroporphyrinogen III synthase HEM4 [Sphingomonadales bacterium CG_4_10_14_3_um_filter_58_15]NCO48678.1 uroporphyrinogen-III synthase [Sphingomonadales bacterium]NCO99577.1 uroporphyrinogen-III synthase [Sphingomonadales bacterium]NCP25953.1 uroporphyrinogen-III synthase [Sphingomonadales bacterium]
MIRPLLILRPLDGALQTERRAKALGLQTIVDPLFAVEPMQWSAPAAQDFDALLLTSANAVTFGGAQLDAYKSLPVLAVGRATAEAAEHAGFELAETGESGGQQLLNALQADRYRRILWLAGEQHSVLDPGDRQLDIVPVYRSRAVALGEQAVACLQTETVVLIHSARAAGHLVSELDRLKIGLNRHHAVVFSTKVAEAAGQGWRSLHIADRPDDESLLSLATRLCQSE